MLPPFIIEQIRQREVLERMRQDDARPRLELPLPAPSRGSRDAQPDDDADRGVVIVDVLG